MGDGFSAFALNLTNLSYDTKHFKLKTADWDYIGSAFVLPMVGLKYTIQLYSEYQNIWDELVFYFEHFMGVGIWENTLNENVRKLNYKRSCS